jgi:4-oxalocrotonate tautomerase
MPYVNIRITREGATAAQKAALISGVTTCAARRAGQEPGNDFRDHR